MPCEIRSNAGYTQTEMAKLANVPQGAVSKFEHGKLAQGVYRERLGGLYLLVHQGFRPKPPIKVKKPREEKPKKLKFSIVPSVIAPPKADEARVQLATDMNALCKDLRNIRGRIPVKELAAQLQVSCGVIYKIEYGYLTCVSPEKLIEILKVYLRIRDAFSEMNSDAVMFP
jgi:hypothetical protein